VLRRPSDLAAVTGNLGAELPTFNLDSGIGPATSSLRTRRT
jgi:hypothetical protein